MRGSDLLDRPPWLWVIIGLILFSAVSFAIETLPNLGARTASFLYYSELVVVAAFTIEYAARIYMAQRRARFIFSFYGLVDLLSILPFYLTFALDLRTLRLLRLFRLIRILKLTRYRAAMLRFGQALALAREELIIFVLASLVLIYLAAVGIYHFEHAVQPDKYRSIFDCLWWAVATLTTVGYGDIYPVTIEGRLFTFLILMLGIGLVAVPTGIMASSLSAIRMQQRRGDESRFGQLDIEDKTVGDAS